MFAVENLVWFGGGRFNLPIKYQPFIEWVLLSALRCPQDRLHLHLFLSPVWLLYQGCHPWLGRPCTESHSIGVDGSPWSCTTQCPPHSAFPQMYVSPANGRKTVRFPWEEIISSYPCLNMANLSHFDFLYDTFLFEFFTTFITSRKNTLKNLPKIMSVLIVFWGCLLL